MHIEFLYTTDCSVAAAMRPRVLSALPPGTPIDLVDLRKVHTNDFRRRYLSGTVLIDGEDLFGEAPSSVPHADPT